AFVDAWVRVRSGTDDAKREARRRFLEPILARLGAGEVGGVGHIAEIADAEPPHAARGCPFQAWSVGGGIRLDRVVLAVADAVTAGRSAIGDAKRSNGEAAVGARASK